MRTRNSSAGKTIRRPERARRVVVQEAANDVGSGDDGEVVEWKTKLVMVRMPRYTLKVYVQDMLGNEIVKMLNSSRLPNGIDSLGQNEILNVYRGEPNVKGVMRLNFNTCLEEALLRKFVKHDCSVVECRNWLEERFIDAFNLPHVLENTSPYLVPILCNWQRFMFSDYHKRPRIAYVSKCGVIIVNEAQLTKHINSSGSRLCLDLFSFSPSFDPYVVFLPDEPVKIMSDISMGIEATPIPVIVSKKYEQLARNELIRLLQNNFTYASTYSFSQLAEAQLSGKLSNPCACEDGKCDEKCACRTLNYRFKQSQLKTRLETPKTVLNRLTEPVEIGIGECNENCGCGAKCRITLTKQAVRPLLCITYMAKKGWGVVTRTDIPEGGYVCSYYGKVFMCEEIVEEGNNIKRYIQDLDFARNKFDVAPTELACINGEEHGNVARFSNHSCSPNLFVQVLFNKTRDIRFPETAFFANRNIGAGEEVTWNYGSTRSGRNQRCFCGEPNCVRYLY